MNRHKKGDIRKQSVDKKRYLSFKEIKAPSNFLLNRELKTISQTKHPKHQITTKRVISIKKKNCLLLN